MQLYFKCVECYWVFKMKDEYDNPATSMGYCPCCGGKRWQILVFDFAGKWLTTYEEVRSWNKHPRQSGLYG